MQSTQQQTCQSCGNKYDKTFMVKMNNQEYVFDSFECAINVLAPRCARCDSRVIGHGVEAKDKVYCCAHCAKGAHETGLVDRIN